jgi:hypothetical protein
MDSETNKLLENILNKLSFVDRSSELLTEHALSLAKLTMEIEAIKRQLAHFETNQEKLSPDRRLSALEAKAELQKTRETGKWQLAASLITGLVAFITALLAYLKNSP